MSSASFIWVFMGVIFVALFAAYIVLAIYFPEWVGITGKKALENHKHHEVESSEIPSEDSQPPVT